LLGSFYLAEAFRNRGSLLSAGCTCPSGAHHPAAALVLVIFISGRALHSNCVAITSPS
jgi:hypothetical protein